MQIWIWDGKWAVLGKTASTFILLYLSTLLSVQNNERKQTKANKLSLKNDDTGNAQTNKRAAYVKVEVVMLVTIPPAYKAPHPLRGLPMTLYWERKFKIVLRLFSSACKNQPYYLQTGQTSPQISYLLMILNNILEGQSESRSNIKSFGMDIPT